MKICGLTRTEDIERAISFGADALGFIFEPTSPRCVLATGDALSWLTSAGPYDLCVAVFGDKLSVTELPNNIKAVQLIGPNDVDRGLHRIQVVRPNDTTTAHEVVSTVQGADALLLDAYSSSHFGGTGERVDLHLAASVVDLAKRDRPELKVILAGGLTPDNVAEAIRNVRPYAVDVSSGVESSPGVKDPLKLRDFIQAAKGL